MLRHGVKYNLELTLRVLGARYENNHGSTTFPSRVTTSRAMARHLPGSRRPELLLAGAAGGACIISTSPSCEILAGRAILSIFHSPLWKTLIVVFSTCAAFAQNGLQSSDLYRLHSVGDVQFSPDGAYLAYAVETNAATGRPFSQLWIMRVADGTSIRMGGENDRGGNPQWSPDGKWIAYTGLSGDKRGLWVAHPDGSNARFLHELAGTNSPLPSPGKIIAWSP